MTEVAPGAVVTSDGDLGVAGRFVDSGVNRGVLIKVAPDGTARYQKRWEGSASSGYSDASLTHDGNICICGSVAPVDGLLQLWSPGGAMLWNKRITSAAGDTVDLLAVTSHSTGIFVAGSMIITGPKLVGLLLRFDLNGNLIWKTSIIGPGAATLEDLKVQRNSSQVGVSLQACGYYTVGSDQDMLYVNHTMDGDQNFAATWGLSGQTDYAASILLLGQEEELTYLAGSGGTSQTVTRLLQFNSGAAVQLNSPASLSVVELLSTALAPLTVVTRMSGSFAVDDFALDLSYSGGTKIEIASTFVDPWAAALYGPNGLFIAGRSTANGPPQVADSGHTAQSITNNWVTIFPSVGNPNLNVSDLSLGTLDVGNFVKDGASSPTGDLFFYVTGH